MWRSRPASPWQRCLLLLAEFALEEGVPIPLTLPSDATSLAVPSSAQSASAPCQPGCLQCPWILPSLSSLHNLHYSERENNSWKILQDRTRDTGFILPCDGVQCLYFCEPVWGEWRGGCIDNWGSRAGLAACCRKPDSSVDLDLLLGAGLRVISKDFSRRSASTFWNLSSKKPSCMDTTSWLRLYAGYSS